MDFKSTKKKGETKICSNWMKYGDCNNKSCHFDHVDCEKFKKTQKCSDTNCGFHRKMCLNWKKEGKCTKANCNFLHKNCDKISCDDKSCPFYHDTFTKNIDDLLEGFRQKCILCESEAILVYLNCGDNIYCETCAKNLVKEGKCKQCLGVVNDYIT